MGALGIEVHRAHRAHSTVVPDDCAADGDPYSFEHGRRRTVVSCLGAMRPPEGATSENVSRQLPCWRGASQGRRQQHYQTRVSQPRRNPEQPTMRRTNRQRRGQNRSPIPHIRIRRSQTERRLRHVKSRVRSRNVAHGIRSNCSSDK